MKLRQHFDYAVRMPIRVTQQDGQLKYYLVFATRHEKAITKMNHAMYKMADMRSREVYETTPEKQAGQMSFFDTENFDEREKEYETLSELNTLKTLIKKNVKTGHTILRQELVTRIVTSGDYFGAFSDAHFTAVLGGRPWSIDYPKDEFISLEDEGVIERSDRASKDSTEIMRIS